MTTLERRAEELAQNMTEAGILPGYEHEHQSYNKQFDTLSYSHDDGTPLSRDPYGPCNLDRNEHGWMMFDDWGAYGVQVSWQDGMWVAGTQQST